MQTETSFEPSDRYTFDCGECSSAKGFAQVDTGQDASYYGTWANPTTFALVCYCEGDVTRQVAEDAAEFRAAVLELKRWCEDGGHGFRGIDPMCKQEIEDAFVSVGLGDLLH